jgi:crotonobetainyl-CoA:carnitine CoA-transferase CaiB-like acyl-CoA transferase
VNPGLVYCSITGFGQDGTYASRPGYDVVAQAMSGAMSVTGQPDGTPGAGPLRAGVATADLFTGMYASVSILAALRHKEHTGEGQYIDCALLDSQIAMLTYHASNWLIGGALPRRLGNAHSLLVPYRAFEVRDGSVMVAVGNDGQFRAFCRILGRPELAEDPRFADSAGRVTNRAVLEPVLEEAIGAFSLAEIVEAMVKAGIPGGPIQPVDQVFEDPQVRARGVVRELSADDGLCVPTVGFPARLSKTPADYRQAPPRLGEHTIAVLSRDLNIDKGEIDALLRAGVVSDGAPSVGTPKVDAK